MNETYRKPAIFVALAVFGVLYNRLVDLLEMDMEIDNDMLTSALVVIGVGCTLLVAAPYIGYRATRRAVVAFAASGLPMVLGHLRRWNQRRA